VTTISTKIIDDIIDAETPNDNPLTAVDERAVVTHRPNDRGGRTQYGISEAANPQAWLDGKVTEAEARAIYEQKYLKPFRGLESHVVYPQLVDWGVTSGPGLAIKKLQEVVGVESDGILGPRTLAEVSALDPITLNNRLVISHVLMIGRLVQKDRRQAENLNGWLARATKFHLDR
jgi:lysozyme family protein